MNAQEPTDGDREDPPGDVIVPEDFPPDPFPAALPGAQPKMVARLIEGRYVVGLTDEERTGRYLMCADLVEQLTGYTEKKHLQRTDLSMQALLDEVDVGIRRKGWELGSVEFDWIMAQLRARFP